MIRLLILSMVRVHDTVCIVYQFPVSNSSDFEILSTSAENEEHSTNYRRLRFDFLDAILPPYPKKPVAETTLLPLNKISAMMSRCRVSKEGPVIQDIVWRLCLVWSLVWNVIRFS